MTDTLHGNVTFRFNYAPPKKVSLHVGKQQVPFTQMHAETQITIDQGTHHFKISLNGNNITYQNQSTTLAAVGLDLPVNRTDPQLADQLRAAVRGAFNADGQPIRHRVKYATNLAEYVQKKMVGPHAEQEKYLSPRQEPGGMNFDFEKSPFKGGQTRLHVESRSDLSHILVNALMKERIALDQVDLNAEQTPVLSIFSTYNPKMPFRKVQLDALREDILRAQETYPRNVSNTWYDDKFEYADAEVRAPKIAQAVRKAVDQVLDDNVVTEPEALKLAKLQENLFEFIMNFPKGQGLAAGTRETLFQKNEASLIQLAEDVVNASLPPTKTPPVPKTKDKGGRH